MTSRTHRRPTTLTLLLAGASIGVALAQENPEPSPEPQLSVAHIASRVAALATSNLDDAQKASLEKTYTEAIEQLTRAAEFERRGVEFDRLTTEAPQRVASFREQLSHPPVAPDTSIPEDATLEQVEQRHARAQATLSAAREALAKLKAESSQRSERQTAAREQDARSRQRLGEISEQLKA